MPSGVQFIFNFFIAWKLHLLKLKKLTKKKEKKKIELLERFFLIL